MDESSTPPANPTKDALEFAESMADREIKNIERLHNRMIWSIGIIATIVLAIIGAIGWIGYDHLQSAATAVVQDQMNKEVTKQVKEQLTKENLSKIVQDEVRGPAAAEIQKAVQKEIEGGPLHEEIVETARKRSEGLVKKYFTPRSLSPVDTKKLQDAIAKEVILKGCTVYVVGMPLNPEAQTYTGEIQEALYNSSMRRSQELDSNKPTYQESAQGVTIYYEQRYGPQKAEALQRAFAKVNINAKIIAWGPLHNLSEKTPTELDVFVGPQEHN